MLFFKPNLTFRKNDFSQKLFTWQLVITPVKEQRYVVKRAQPWGDSPWCRAAHPADTGPASACNVFCSVCQQVGLISHLMISYGKVLVKNHSFVILQQKLLQYSIYAIFSFPSLPVSKDTLNILDCPSLNFWLWK